MAVPSVPTYVRVASYYLWQAREGVLRVGDHLPGTKAMAETWETSENTIRRALAFLEWQGMISRPNASYPIVISAWLTRSRDIVSESPLMF